MAWGSLAGADLSYDPATGMPYPTMPPVPYVPPVARPERPRLPFALDGALSLRDIEGNPVALNEVPGGAFLYDQGGGMYARSGANAGEVIPLHDPGAQDAAIGRYEAATKAAAASAIPPAPGFGGMLDQLTGSNGQERVQLWPERMARDLYGDVDNLSHGRIPAGEEQARAAFNIAGTIAGGAMPMAEKGAVGVFGGRGFGSLNPNKLEKTPGLPMDEASRLARRDEQGFMPDDWYHGSARIDRVTENGKLDPKRATSGPMPYFTDDPAVASSYATKKADTSLPDADHIGDYFTVSPKDLGRRDRKPIPIEQTWGSLSPEQRAVISEQARRVGYENIDEAAGPLTLHPPGVNATGAGDHYDWILKNEARGNPLRALRELWYDSGRMVGSENELSDVWKLAGYPHPISDAAAPWVEARGVMPAAIRMRNPLQTGDTTNLIENVIPKLEEAFKRDRTQRPYDAQAFNWDKDTRYTPREWVAELKRDALAGSNSFVYTSIPDKVTAALRDLGYDGIMDTGGKMGGEGHRVAIPFGNTQVRSKYARFDPLNEGKAFLLGSGDSRATAAVPLIESAQERSSFGSMAPRFIDRGNGMFDARVGDKLAGSASVAGDGAKPFLSSVFVEPEFQKQGIGRALYEKAEASLGRPLVPSPLGLSDDAMRIWQKRLAAMDPAQAHALVEEARKLGLDYGISPEHINQRFGSLMPQGIRAYHGSPHDFYRFDMSKIGTGEGAQSYGHGLYLAGNEAVARQYRDTLTNKFNQDQPKTGFYMGRDPVDTWGLGLSQLNDQFAKVGGGAEGIITQPQILHSIDAELAPLRSGRFKGPLAAENLKKWEDARAFVETRPGMSWKPEPFKGHMYEVNIAADPAHMLDWDKPLSRQPNHVQSALEQFGLKADRVAMAEHDDALLRALQGGPTNLPKMPSDPMGANIYESSKIVLGGYRDPGRSTSALRDAGIPGIKYLDQGSRGGLTPSHRVYQEGDKFYASGKTPREGGPFASAKEAQQWVDQQATHNYVMFDDKLISILKKYGLLGAIGGSQAFGSLAPSGSQEPPL